MTVPRLRPGADTIALLARLERMEGRARLVAGDERRRLGVPAGVLAVDVGGGRLVLATTGGELLAVYDFNEGERSV